MFNNFSVAVSGNYMVVGRVNEVGIYISVLRVLVGEGRMREKEVEIRCKIEGNLKKYVFLY